MKNHPIYTITANPALDLSGHVKKIIPDEKNDVTRARLDPGGNAINAARIAKRLGSKPVLLGFVGGAPGEELKTLLKREGLAHRFTRIQGNTRTNVTVTNDEDHRQTRLTFPGPRVRGSEIKALLRVIRSLKSPGVLVVGGSPPGKGTHDFFPRLIRAAMSRNLGVIVDVPAPELKIILQAGMGKLLLIKPNLTEFEALTGKKFATDAGIAKEACKLLPKCEIVCVSLARRGVILVWNHQAWLLRSPRIHPRGSVGAGDSMVGAVTARLAHFGLTHPEIFRECAPILDALKWGVAAGAATATTEGTSLGKASLIRNLYPKCRVSHIWSGGNK